MKLRTTTPASKSFIGKFAIIFVVLTIAFIAPVQFLQNDVKACSTIEECDAEIAAREQDIAEYQGETEKLNKQAMTLESTLNKLANEKAVIQAELDISQAKYNKLLKQIAETEQKIKDNQNALGEILANMYVDGKVTPLEMLASSDTIGDYLDKQEYQSSIRDQLTATIDSVKKLKADLVTKKDDVKKILDKQKAERNALADKEAQQRGILADTQGQEANYQKLIAENEDAIALARAYQAALAARYSGTGGYILVDGGLLGDYPWNATNCPMWYYYSTLGADGNGGDGHGYGCRQCASYVAWRMAKETGIYPSWGNAADFTAGATSLGFKEGAPQAGSIAVMDPWTAGNPYGHVAWVEAVSGGQVLISQYNFDYGAGYGMYSQMWLSSAAFDHYVHIK